jgi:malate dehydrogenase (oxaloacetate-decarboxylating)(NADP+)
METGVARKPISDFDAYKRELAARLDPRANSLASIFDRVQANPQRIIFAEGEEEKTIRAAVHWRDNGYGTPVLVGKANRIRETIKNMNIKNADDIEITNAAVSSHVSQYVDYLYKRLQRQGFLYRDITRWVKNDRNIFASCMLACGHGDAMITGLTRGYHRSMDSISRAIDVEQGKFPFAISMFVTRHRTVFMSDTEVQELPSPEQLADIAEITAQKARQMGHTPRVAMLSYSTFGNPMREKSERIRQAVKVLDSRKVDFEYEGEMGADVALNKEMRSLYPFSRLSADANVLVMPALHTAHIAQNILSELGDGTHIGPILCGFSKSVQIAQMDSSVADLINLAAIAAIDAIERKVKAGKSPKAVKAAEVAPAKKKSSKKAA